MLLRPHEGCSSREKSRVTCKVAMEPKATAATHTHWKEKANYSVSKNHLTSHSLLIFPWQAWAEGGGITPVLA